MPTSVERATMLNEIRYAERLCQRTARLYRRVQVVSTFFAIVGGSAAFSNIFTSTAPTWLPLVGGALLAVFGAISISVRPADKAAHNEQDVKRYAALRAKEQSFVTDSALRQAIDEAHNGDAPEIDSLRDVAYNDVVRESGQPSYAVNLSLQQKLIAALA